MISQLFSILEQLRNTLNMNSDTFYSLLIGLLPLFIPLTSRIYSKFKEYIEKKIFELYCKRESDNFFVFIMFTEIGIIILSIIVVVFIETVIAESFSCLINKTELVQGIRLFILVVISVIFAVSMMRMKWVRKRLLGDKIGKVIIWCSIVLIDVSSIGAYLDVFYSIPAFGIKAYLLNEIIGLLYFQGRYTKYEFSSLKLYINNGKCIVCEDIEKISRRKKFIIVAKENENIVLQYNQIVGVEYYGQPKYVVKENVAQMLVCRIIDRTSRGNPNI